MRIQENLEIINLQTKQNFYNCILSNLLLSQQKKEKVVHHITAYIWFAFGDSQILTQILLRSATQNIRYTQNVVCAILLRAFFKRKHYKLHK